MMEVLAGCTQKQLFQFLSQHYVTCSLLFWCCQWSDVTVNHTVSPGPVLHHVLYVQTQSPGA